MICNVTVDNAIVCNEKEAFTAQFTLRVSHMVGSKLIPANLTEEGIFELFRQELDSYVMHPWAWMETSLVRPFYAFLVPVLALLTSIVHALSLAVFVKEKLLSPINILMIAIAVMDSLTVILPSPFLMFVHFSGIAPFVPMNLCRVYDYFGKYLPEISHTASIWMTLGLSMQRFIGVCKPFYASRYCTRRTSIRIIVTAITAAIMIHLSRFIDTTYVTLIVHDAPDQRDPIVTCQGVHAAWLAKYSIEYECIYYWTIIFLVKVIPFLTIVTLDILMSRQLRHSARNRRKYVSTEVISNKHGKESRRVTRTVILVTIFIVLVEIPLTVILIVWTLTMIHQRFYVSEETLGSLSVMFNLMIYVSFPSIFLMYCAMCERFRRGFRKILHCK